MNNLRAEQRSYDAPLWYVLHTHPRQENRVEFNLCSQKIETLNPRIQQRRYNEFTGKPIVVVKSLFPRYIFARFSAKKSLRQIRFTRGVHSVVSFGGGPISVLPDLIELIESRIGKDGFVILGDDVEPGDEVIINQGPLKGFTGIFQQRMDSNTRVVVLLSAVNYQPRITLEGTCIAKVHSDYVH